MCLKKFFCLLLSALVCAGLCFAAAAEAPEIGMPALALETPALLPESAVAALRRHSLLYGLLEQRADGAASRHPSGRLAGTARYRFDTGDCCGCRNRTDDLHVPPG